jgi:anti-sigma B factor antagonist
VGAVIRFLFGGRKPRVLGEIDSRLDVQDVAAGAEHRLVLTGEVDIATAAGVEEAARGICAGRLERLVIDLRKVTFLDSSGLAVILRVYNLCRARGLELGLIPGPAQTQRVFELTGLSELLPFQGPG